MSERAMSVEDETVVPNFVLINTKFDETVVPFRLLARTLDGVEEHADARAVAIRDREQQRPRIERPPRLTRREAGKGPRERMAVRLGAHVRLPDRRCAHAPRR